MNATTPVEEGQLRLLSITERLIAASEKKSMSTLADHPWDVPLGAEPWLKKKERISIYGTPYWDLASDEEKRLLAREEIVTWWSGFIGLEGLVVEHYMRFVNAGAFEDLPQVEEYMKHFIKEELIHTIVFKKAIRYFGTEMYPVPKVMMGIYDDNTTTGRYPLMAVYLTMVVEWLADLYQKLDVDADYVHPMARTVSQEHWKEEMRHIKWGQAMITQLAHTDPEFQLAVREMTPAFLRQLIDQGVTNVDCFDRIGFKDPAFQDKEALLEAVLYSDHRRKLNHQLALPMVCFFVSAGIYDPAYHELWEQMGFGDELAAALN